MILLIFAVLSAIILLFIVFWDSKVFRDIKLEYYDKKVKPKSRMPITPKRSQPTYQYQAEYGELRCFSRPRDGMDQYDFNVPSLPHNCSTYHSSKAFMIDKRIKKSPRFQQPSVDSSIVENHRFYHESAKWQNSNISNKNDRSNYEIHRAASRFQNNRMSTSVNQILSSAKYPAVLLADEARINKKEASKNEPPKLSIPSSPAAPTSNFTIPAAPSSTSTSVFNFDFSKLTKK